MKELISKINIAFLMCLATLNDVNKKAFLDLFTSITNSKDFNTIPKHIRDYAISLGLSMSFNTVSSKGKGTNATVKAITDILTEHMKKHPLYSVIHELSAVKISQASYFITNNGFNELMSNETISKQINAILVDYVNKQPK